MIATKKAQSILSKFEHGHEHLVITMYADTDSLSREERIKEVKGALETEFHRNSLLCNLSHISLKVKNEVLEQVSRLESSPQALALFVSFQPDQDSKKEKDIDLTIHLEQLPMTISRTMVFVSDIPDIRHLSDSIHRSQSTLVLSLHEESAHLYEYLHWRLEPVKSFTNTRVDVSDPNVEADERSSLKSPVMSGGNQDLRGEGEYMHGVGGRDVENREMDQNRTFVIEMLKNFVSIAEDRHCQTLVIAAAVDLRQYVMEHMDILQPEHHAIYQLEANVQDEKDILERTQTLLSEQKREPLSYYSHVHPSLKIDKVSETLEALMKGNVQLEILDPESVTMPDSKDLTTYKKSLIPEQRSLESHIAMKTIEQGGDVLVAHREVDSFRPVWTVKRFSTS